MLYFGYSRTTICAYSSVKHLVGDPFIAPIASGVASCRILLLLPALGKCVRNADQPRSLTSRMVNRSDAQDAPRTSPCGPADLALHNLLTISHRDNVVKSVSYPTASPQRHDYNEREVGAELAAVLPATVTDPALFWPPARYGKFGDDAAPSILLTGRCDVGSQRKYPEIIAAPDCWSMEGGSCLGHRRGYDGTCFSMRLLTSASRGQHPSMLIASTFFEGACATLQARLFGSSVNRLKLTSRVEFLRARGVEEDGRFEPPDSLRE